MGAEERRGYFRRQFSEDERYFLEFKPAGKFFSKSEVALTMNLSASGLLFRCNKIITVNTLLKLSMVLPRVKKAIPIQARVVRIEPAQREGMYNVAVFYTEISDADRFTIDQFCNEKRGPSQEAPQGAEGLQNTPQQKI